MRNRLVAGVAAIALTMLLGSASFADPIPDYSIGTATKETLGANANPATVEAWLEQLLGGKQVNLVYDYQAPKGYEATSLNELKGFDWDYAVVKYAGKYTAYLDSGNDNFISIGPLSNSISSIRYFSVPEPGALLLLGVGLVAAAPFVRSRLRRV